MNESTLEKIKKRTDEIEQIAIGLGFPCLRNSKGERYGIGQRMPSATEIIGLMFDEEGMYRLASAVAHA